jgi:L-amino acid N-acyltransferase YncA
MGTATGLRITAMGPEHADEVLTIYRLGINEGNATFETTATTWQQFDATKLPGHRHVAVDGTGRALGWVAAVPVSDRCAYAGVVETRCTSTPATAAGASGRLSCAR